MTELSWDTFRRVQIHAALADPAASSLSIGSCSQMRRRPTDAVDRALDELTVRIEQVALTLDPD
jgi:hypothetical protein